MKYGIYYAYWEDQWKADYFRYIEKAAKLGFDFLEIACTPINGYDRQTLTDLRKCAADNGIFLTAGHGPNADQNLASADPAVVANAKAFFTTLLKNLETLGIRTIGGAIRSTKGLLGHFHTGECNRRVPGRGRTPWHEIATTLADIGYDGTVCMEPFVRMGGKVGEDIKIWRELEPGIDEAKMDADAKAALDFERIVFEGIR